MSPRKTFTPKTHYSTVKHNEIKHYLPLSTKKSASSNSITAIKITESFSRTVYQNLKIELLTNYRHKQTSE